MTSFPDTCLRGLVKDDIASENALNSNAFFPDLRTSANRQDRGIEKSINWEDDNTVVAFTLRQFPIGYARLARAAIDTINGLPGVNNSLSYERAPLSNNPYHGNIVYQHGLSKPLMRAISASLTLACSDVVIK